MITEKQKQEFIELSMELEPERLYCDGERSAKEAKVVYNQIIKKWKALEKKVGRSVDPYEFYD